jgi:hypothetical protein
MLLRGLLQLLLLLGLCPALCLACLPMSYSEPRTYYVTLMPVPSILPYKWLSWFFEPPMLISTVGPLHLIVRGCIFLFF